MSSKMWRADASTVKIEAMREALLPFVMRY